MATVDYSLLFDRRPHLALHYDPAHPTMRWRMNDMETGQTFARATTLQQAVQFMRAAVRKGDATFDKASVEFHSWLADEGTWSVRVPDPPSNVLPFPRMLEPLDELA